MEISERRVEIDTSAPFESVKEAVTRFGGIGYWKPNLNKTQLPLSPSLSHEDCSDEVDIAKVEEEAKQLERDLFVKERETLEVLKELESTKSIVEELKIKLQREEFDVSATLDSEDDQHKIPACDEAEKENVEFKDCNIENESCPQAASPPNLILMELQQAKLNLTKTTTDLADIRASVESYSKKIEKERLSLEKTRERLALKSAKISSLEEELNQTTQKPELTKGDEIRQDSDNTADVSRGLQQLNEETEQFKKMGEAARTEVMRAISEIEETKMKMRTAEIRLVAAKKMKEAAQAAEAVALSEIKALSKHESPSGGFSGTPETVTLSSEEYTTLTCKARDAEERSKKRVIDAMLQVDEANISKMEILKRVEEATEVVKSSKKALEEALNRVEAANRGKLAVEEALRKWRSDHGHKRRILNNSTKFKNPYPSHHRRESCLLDVNGLNLVNDGPNPVLKPTLSIGQILSRKLLMPEEFETGTLAERSSAQRKVSLGQMLHKQSGELSFSRNLDREGGHRPFSAKRKKFGFGRFSLRLTKQSKKKKPTLDLR